MINDITMSICIDWLTDWLIDDFFCSHCIRDQKSFSTVRLETVFVFMSTLMWSLLFFLFFFFLCFHPKMSENQVHFCVWAHADLQWKSSPLDRFLMNAKKKITVNLPRWESLHTNDPDFSYCTKVIRTPAGDPSLEFLYITLCKLSSIIVTLQGLPLMLRDIFSWMNRINNKPK